MNVETFALAPWQIALLIALGVLILGLVVWLVRRRSGGRGRFLTDRQRYEALTREHASLSEKYGLMAERLDRLDRAHKEMREELLAFREDLSKRLDVREGATRIHTEMQEQIFELREEVKVLMQRDDRHERTLQELQGDVNAVRNGH